MTKYKCGHESNTIIMNETIVGLSTWISWKNDVGFDGDKSQCWSCYCEELHKRGD